MLSNPTIQSTTSSAKNCSQKLGKGERVKECADAQNFQKALEDNDNESSSNGKICVTLLLYKVVELEKLRGHLHYSKIHDGKKDFSKICTKGIALMKLLINFM